jgi:hypothetical protein
MSRKYVKRSELADIMQKSQKSEAGIIFKKGRIQTLELTEKVKG